MTKTELIEIWDTLTEDEKAKYPDRELIEDIIRARNSENDGSKFDEIRSRMRSGLTD